MPLVVMCAVVAFHAIVSHKAYCQLLLEHDLNSPDSAHIQNALSALEPSAQLTFAACLACLATQHWHEAAQKPAGNLVRLIPEDTLITICSSIQAAVLVGVFLVHRVSSLRIAFLSVRAQHTFAST